MTLCILVDSSQISQPIVLVFIVTPVFIYHKIINFVSLMSDLVDLS